MAAFAFLFDIPCPRCTVWPVRKGGLCLPCYPRIWYSKTYFGGTARLYSSGTTN